MYKVTNVSAPALCPTSSHNGLLCENTVFSVWLYEKVDVIPCLWLPDFCMKPCEISIHSIHYYTDYLPYKKDHVYAFSIWSQSIASNHHNNLANVKITSPRTRSRNLAPLCHNSSWEALGKHLTPTGLHWLHIQGEYWTPLFSCQRMTQIRHHARTHISTNNHKLSKK